VDRVNAEMSGWEEERRRRDRARRNEVMSLPVLPLRRHGVIDGPDGDVLACASVGPAGEVVAVWTTPDGLEGVTSATVSAAGASFPDPGAAQPVAARITVHTPELAAVTRIADLALAHITAQPMPGGRFLVAAARCRWRPDGPDCNAVLYDTDGQVVSEHVLGDGIAHVLADSTGQIWAGYFDEGIYGNYGWGRADSEEPIGAYGIVRFSPDLEPTWHYPKYTEVGPWDAVSDCYALNVDDTSAWACYYSDFPVVRIRDGAVTGWHNGIRGASALAVAGSRVALFGGYGPDCDRLALVELDADRARPAAEYRAMLPDGEPLAPGVQVIGRGSRLHFLTGNDWYQLDVSDIPQ
jgi:hypothetical protein